MIINKEYITGERITQRYLLECEEVLNELYIGFEIETLHKMLFTRPHLTFSLDKTKATAKLLNRKMKQIICHYYSNELLKKGLFCMQSNPGGTYTFGVQEDFFRFIRQYTDKKELKLWNSDDGTARRINDILLDATELSNEKKLLLFLNFEQYQNGELDDIIEQI